MDNAVTLLLSGLISGSVAVTVATLVIMATVSGAMVTDCVTLALLVSVPMLHISLLPLVTHVPTVDDTARICAFGGTWKVLVTLWNVERPLLFTWMEKVTLLPTS